LYCKVLRITHRDNQFMDAGITAVPSGESAEERARTPRRILLEGASLGIVADVALRTAPGGLGWSLWVLALALAALNVARHDGLGTTREQRGWLAMAATCALAFAWRDAEALRVANVLGTLVALALFAMAAAGRPASSILVARVRDVVSAGVFSLRDLLIGAPLLIARDADLLALPAVRGGASWTALRALLLTAPLVLVFNFLLSRADPVFGSLLRLPALDLPTLLPHLFVAGAFAWGAAGWLRGAILGLAPRPTLPATLPIQLGAAEVTTALGAVIALFAVFVALQLRWLFGGADVVLATTGLTVAEYARRGFFELVAVAALVLPLILGTRAAIDAPSVVERHRRLSLVLLALLAAIVASALLRMQLYVTYFGLTTDRLYATAMMGWIAVVCAAMVFTVLRGEARALAAIAVLSGFAMLGALNAGNPELIIARVNLARGQDGPLVDFPYLARLGGDAVPAVVQALRGAVPSAESCRAATELRARWLRDDDVAWNLGAHRGRKAVAGLPTAAVARLCGGPAQPTRAEAGGGGELPRRRGMG